MTSEFAEFIDFITPITKRKKYSKVFYYPEKSLVRIKNDQMNIFVDECISCGLIYKEKDDIHITEKGREVISSKQISKLSEPYRNALKKINKLYIDVLI